MAENTDTETLDSPSDTEQNHLPSTQVTETHDIVTPHSDASLALEAAFEERAKKRTEEQAAAEDAEISGGEPEAAKADKPEKAAEAAKEEPEETDPRKRIKKQIEDAEKEAEAEKAEEAGKAEETPEEVQFPEGVKSQKAKDRFVELTRARRAAEERAAQIEKEVAARDAKIKELEGRKPEGVPDDVKAQLDELAMFRRQYQLENSPEIKAQFDAIVEQGEKFIGETLKGYGIAEATVKMIEGEGGFAAFSRSNKTASLKNESGDYEVKTYAEIAKDWLNGMNVADAEAIRAKLGEQRNTLDAKKRFIDAEKGKAKEYFTTQSEQYQSSVKAQQENALKQREQIDNFIKKATTETPWMKDKEIPATATPEQRREIEAENKTASDLRNILTATLNVKTMEELLDAALDATAYHKTRLDLARANKRIKELEAKESKRKAASATTVKQGSIASPPVQKTRKQENNWVDAADALEQALDRKARGED